MAEWFGIRDHLAVQEMFQVKALVHRTLDKPEHTHRRREKHRNPDSLLPKERPSFGKRDAT